ncbi:MAG: type II toxin-antitoxin system VapC family toxin [Candidatus Portnoybacteria bacterium]|nr:type II toxin-antitoxin system VapC family toxin [Candidatus Portnoybacteria bacterium]
MTPAFLEFLEKHRSLFLDSMIFIYFFEGFTPKEERLKLLFSRIESGLNLGYTSLITLSEVLVKPYQRQDNEVINEYIRFFQEFPHIDILSMNQIIAIRSAQLRARYRIRTPDALQVASALEYAIEGFITADRALNTPELPIFYL